MKSKNIILLSIGLILFIALFFPYNKVMDDKKIQCDPQETFLNLEVLGNFLERIGNDSLNTVILNRYKHCRSSGQYFAVMGWEIRQYKSGEKKYARYILSETMLGVYVTPKERQYVITNCHNFLKNAKRYDPNLKGMEYMWAGDRIPVYAKSLSVQELKSLNVNEPGNSKKVYFQYIYKYLDPVAEKYVENNCSKILFNEI